ncbi:hypothetical protein [Streptomyces kanamyceticus]|uniref:hypothetical protein n=1 Tax=Streptomyces kanamyceticus TaxID=1967 RepID=UPI0037DD03A2
MSSSADEPDADDLKVAIVRILADPDSGRRVTRETKALLDANDPEAMRAWPEAGYRITQAEDDRVAIARILADSSISPALCAAANAALDDNTPEALRHFLEVGSTRSPDRHGAAPQRVARVWPPCRTPGRRNAENPGGAACTTACRWPHPAGPLCRLGALRKALWPRRPVRHEPLTPPTAESTFFE